MASAAKLYVESPKTFLAKVVYRTLKSVTKDKFHEITTHVIWASVSFRSRQEYREAKEALKARATHAANEILLRAGRPLIDCSCSYKNDYFEIVEAPSEQTVEDTINGVKTRGYSLTAVKAVKDSFEKVLKAHGVDEKTLTSDELTDLAIAAIAAVREHAIPNGVTHNPTATANAFKDTTSGDLPNGHPLPACLSSKGEPAKPKRRRR